MSTFSQLAYHVVFSTKYRLPLIEQNMQKRLYEYIGGIIRSQKGSLIEVGGMEDHIHLLINILPTKPVSDAIREIKANSSRWMNMNGGNKFEWQKGYGAFSVSHSQKDVVCHYIQNQRQHHEKKSFKEEYLKLLTLHEIRFDPKYAFDEEHYG